MSRTDMTEDLGADDARRQLVDRLTARGWITRPEVAAAFTTVPRHLFAPAGTSMQAAYADDVVITQRGPDGRATSSISAPWLQAYMLHAAQLKPGHRVLELGSGGYNAALLAEIVGATGSVVSVDIDAQVVANAQTALGRAGYQQVQAICADGEYGYPAGGPYDAIIVTVEAADIPPAWTEQLTAGGVFVVPLRMRGHTRCLTLQRHTDHLVATASTQCGFVPMRGDGGDPVRRIPLRGDDATLILDDPTTEVDSDKLRAALDQPSTRVWAPATLAMSMGTLFEALHLFLASQPRPYGILTVDRERTAGLLEPQDKFFCPTLLTDDSLAYLTMRRHDDQTWQLGAHGFGPDAATLTADLAGMVTVWDEQYRHTGGPQITVHPAGTRLPDTDRLRLTVPRRHTLTAITWPQGSR